MVSVGVEPLAGQVETFKLDMSYFLIEAPFGIFLFDGAESCRGREKHFTPCSEITRQKAPASGVPMGLPS